MRNSHTSAGARRRAGAAAMVAVGAAAVCSLMAAAPASAVSVPSLRDFASLPATGQVGSPMVGSVDLPSVRQSSADSTTAVTFTLYGPATFKAVTGANVAPCSISTSGVTATCTEAAGSSASSGGAWVVSIMPTASGTVTLVGSANGDAVTVTGSTTIVAAAPAAPPVVTGIAPASGPTAGGTSVTVAGTGFTDATSVDFGTVPATSATVGSDTSITAAAPPSAAGAVDLTVTGPGGTSATSSADQYTYTASAPTVSAVVPHRGFAAGGRWVIIAGTGFTGATGVAFGGTAATSFTVDSDGYITAVAPAGTGTVDVTVTTPAGTSATSTADQYTYRPDRTRLVAHPATVSAGTGGDVSLTPSATLIDRVAGSPVAGQTIAFTVRSQPLCTAVTDAAGNAQCTGTAPQTDVSTACAYSAQFAGTPTLAATRSWGRLVGV